ncbi:MAG: tRNA lysidine(34) synthetase TilS [bacterium]|nr:tRNA lysidine(34) synthetase TilS [bacterium]
MVPQKVKNLIYQKELIKKYDKIIIGVSGGPDSIALLHFLREVKEEYKIQLYIAHLNYMLRGEESKEDEYFVKKIAQEYKLAFFIRRVVLSRKRGISIQEEARNKRREYFIEISGKIGANKIALGHNYEDQTETIFMRIMSGCGPEGFKGIPVKRELTKNVIIIRPLLDLQKKEIEEYLNTNNISFRVDSSNLEKKYTRNKIRIDIFPKIKKINPKFEKSLRRIANLWQKDNEYLEKIAEKQKDKLIINNSCNEIIINNEELKQLPWCLKSRIIRILLKKFYENINKINFSHINDIVSLTTSSPNAEVGLPNSIRVFRRYNELVINKKKKEELFNYEYQVKIPGTIYLKEIKAKMEFKENLFQNKELSKNKLEITLDYDKIAFPIKIRSRKAGDRFHPLGLNGSKKVKDFFINKKISSYKRKRIPLVIDRTKILWITGMEISELAKIGKDTKRILQIKYFHGI